MNEEYVWKDVGVVGFDELMQALERADRKGYMPDAVKEAWEGFNWKPAQRTWVNATTWRGLTDDEILYCVELENPKAIAEEVEAKLKEKNT